MQEITLGLAAAFVAAVTLVLVGHAVVAERRQVHRSLRSIRTIDLAGADLRASQLAAPMASRVLMPGMLRVGRGLRRFTPGSVLTRLDHQLQTAGSPAGWDAERFLAAKVVSLAGLFVGSIAITSMLQLGATRTVPIIGFATAVGYYVPEWVIRSQSEKRQALIQRHLPDALDLLSITVEAGLGFDAAVQRVSRQIEGPLGQEFHRVVQEMQLGKSRADALRDLSERTTVPELRSFVLAMVQADIFGIPIAHVLKVQADELRMKRRQRAEEKAQKIPVKILGPLLIGIFPALMITIIGPGAIQI
ncbi:MAG: type II secretion system F family protein, partial [Actinobacteria bacterium]|nr:type II secretion system F family protein [Actinomycetota bacterium]